jgi:hypothetical protein
MIEIISNGSKWYGQKPDSIEQLLKVLAVETLDPRFNSFVHTFNPYRGWNEGNEKYKGCTSISGNFLTLSHAFNIITDEQETISVLTEAINKNLATEEYRLTRIEYLTDEEMKKQINIMFMGSQYNALRLGFEFPSTDEGKQLREQIKNELIQSI